MAERRYSESDQQKILQDKMADWRAKGIDAREMRPLHPGGQKEAIKEIERDLSFSKDQAQAWEQHNQENVEKLRKDL